jgi:hypothetical protein
MVTSSPTMMPVSRAEFHVKPQSIRLMCVMVDNLIRGVARWVSHWSDRSIHIEYYFASDTMAGKVAGSLIALQSPFHLAGEGRLKSGLGGEQTESNQRLMYTSAWASPQKCRAPTAFAACEFQR